MPDFKKYRSLADLVVTGNRQANDLVCSRFGLTDLGPTARANLSANLVTTMQAGAFAGALLANPIADRWGRKPCLFVVSILAFIGGLLQAFSYGHLACFYIGR